jgi:hypothetical protein
MESRAAVRHFSYPMQLSVGVLVQLPIGESGGDNATAITWPPRRADHKSHALIHEHGSC